MVLHPSSKRGITSKMMSTASLPSKLALGLVVLSAVLAATLYTIHNSASFHIKAPSGWIMDTPEGLGGSDEASRRKNEREQSRREMLETEQSTAAEADFVEEEEEERGPMNIILFYADDWRHDVRSRSFCLAICFHSHYCRSHCIFFIKSNSKSYLSFTKCTNSFYARIHVQTLGAAGNPIVKTPVLDALAKEGVRFTQNCVTTSICWISRATLYR